MISTGSFPKALSGKKKNGGNMAKGKKGGKGGGGKKC